MPTCKGFTYKVKIDCPDWTYPDLPRFRKTLTTDYTDENEAHYDCQFPPFFKNKDKSISGIPQGVVEKLRVTKLVETTNYERERKVKPCHFYFASCKPIENTCQSRK